LPSAVIYDLLLTYGAGIEYEGIVYPAALPLIRDENYVSGAILKKFKNNSAITAPTAEGLLGPSSTLLGISFYNGKSYVTDWTWGVIWEYDNTDTLVGGFSFNVSVNGGSGHNEALGNIEVNQGRIVTAPQYFDTGAYIFDLKGNFLYTVPPIESGFTAYSFVIMNNQLIINWYGWGETQSYIAVYKLADGTLLGYYAVPATAINIVSMTTYKGVLYALESGRSATYTTQMLHQFNMANGALIKSTDLRTTGMAGDMINFSDTIFFGVVDVAVNKDGIWIAGTNIMTSFVPWANWASFIESLPSVHAGIYKFDLNMKYQKNLDAYPKTQRSWLEPMAMALKYPAVAVNGDKYV
jgi:hypothetical protein